LELHCSAHNHWQLTRRSFSSAPRLTKRLHRFFKSSSQLTEPSRRYFDSLVRFTSPLYRSHPSVLTRTITLLMSPISNAISRRPHAQIA
jgi:hypothetical protein